MAIIKRTKKIYSKLEMPSNSELKEDQIVPGIILKQICSSLWKVEKKLFSKAASSNHYTMDTDSDASLSG